MKSTPWWGWLNFFKFNSTFARGMGALVGSTALAQLLALAALPVLTRLFSPADFSLLAVYVALSTLIGTVTCMRLDAAIPLPEDENEALNLLLLGLLSSIAVTAILCTVIGLWGDVLAQAAGRPDFSPFLWLVPIGTALTGIYSAFQYMAVRQKAFGLIARTRLTQAVTGLGTQVALGLAGAAPIGLMIGHILMSGAGVATLALRSLRVGILQYGWPSWVSLKKTLLCYRRFPQYSVAEELTNNAGIQLPILLIGTFLVGAEAGFIFLAMRVVGAPMTVIGSAVSQVYYAHAADYQREGCLAEETSRVFRRISMWLVVPMVALGPFVPFGFRVVFGTEWERAGVLLVWMLPWYAFRLISSPISMVMHVRMKQQLMLMLTIAGFVLRIAPLGLALAWRPEMASVTYAVTSAVFYAIITSVFLFVAGLSQAAVIYLMAESIFSWLVVAFFSFLICLAF
ncbi:lipopolysaccharide biosynthesis protein [Azonexus sp.]|uniref:lipopolysaccharide biosynthesis protein n=1 Tax=Azonexus sp. TaxID=1872668 RepID=UPI0035B0405E